MALNANSYSSVRGVATMTRHMLDGEPAFDESSIPSLPEVEDIIDELSAELNDAISACGFSVPITTAGPKLACDLWVRSKAAAMVELTQRSAGFDGGEDSRYNAFWNLYPGAVEWVASKKEAWQNQGVTVSIETSDALTYTALNKHSERADPDSDTKEQPRFRRRQFDI